MSNSAQLKSTRDAFGEALIELFKDNENLVALTADLAESTRINKLEELFPQRFIQVGVAEQNLAGIAAGLSLEGKIPVITSFSAFSPYGNWAQIRTSTCYSNENVKIVGSHAGLSAAKDGATHQALEDIALMRVLPNMTVLSPVDYEQTKKAVKVMVEHKGPVYLRLSRENTEIITAPKDSFEIGKAEVLKKGSDITVIGTGPVTVNALRAAEKLGTSVSCEVVNCSSIKPLDAETILSSVEKTGKVVTVEEHQLVGGLGGAVCELLSTQFPAHVKVLGVNDSFGESGNYEELLNKHGLTAEKIANSIKKFLKEEI